ncbi:MAG: hypothetical protein P8173_14955 [Gammaproteobacteria bacterium]
MYRGNNSAKTKIELPKAEIKWLTTEQKAAIKACHEENARRVANEQRAEAERSALRVQRVWSNCSLDTESGYLTRKQIGAYGVLFRKSGALVVPMCDTSGKIHGLQFILDKSTHAPRIKRTGRDKGY